jgi:hypothetical protein
MIRHAKSGITRNASTQVSAMHNLRYMTFDTTQAMLVVGLGVTAIVALHVLEIVADRRAHERTQRALRATEKAAERSKSTSAADPDGGVT